MVIGSIMLIDAPIPELRPSLKFIIPVAVGLSMIFIFLIVLAVRAQLQKASTGREGLLDEIGETRTALSPEGKVFVGNSWREGGRVFFERTGWKNRQFSSQMFYSQGGAPKLSTGPRSTNMAVEIEKGEE